MILISAMKGVDIRATSDSFSVSVTSPALSLRTRAGAAGEHVGADQLESEPVDGTRPKGVGALEEVLESWRPSTGTVQVGAPKRRAGGAAVAEPERVVVERAPRAI